MEHLAILRIVLPAAPHRLTSATALLKLILRKFEVGVPETLESVEGMEMPSSIYSSKKMAFHLTKWNLVTQRNACGGRARDRGVRSRDDDQTIKILYPRNCPPLEAHDVYTMTGPNFHKRLTQLHTNVITHDSVMKFARIQEISRNKYP
jgi:hypothetical protein